MTRVARRYAIHLILNGAEPQVVHFASLDAFQSWYGEVLHGAATTDTFVNVPISELEGEYLLLRAGSVIGLRVEPIYGSGDD